MCDYMDDLEKRAKSGIFSYEQARKEAVECVSSLHQAVQEAGGTIMDGSRLESITLMDFITQVASQNGIRFVYVPRKKE